MCYSFIISLVLLVFMVISHWLVTNLPSPKISWQNKWFLRNYKDFYHFWIFGCITFLSFHLFVFFAQYLLLKSSNKFRIFAVTIFYHLFIWKKYVTFSISNRNKSDDKKVTQALAWCVGDSLHLRCHPCKSRKRWLALVMKSLP